MKSFKLTNPIPVIALAGLLVLLALGLAGLVFAQEETTATTETTTTETAISAETIPTELIPVAQELGCDTRSECATAFDKNFNQAVEIAIKHDIYRADPEKQDLASTYQKEVLARLTSISAENLEDEIIRIAKDLVAKKPALARDLGASKANVNAAETMVKEVKNAGVSMDICSQSEESLEREQLIACLKAVKNLSKKSTVMDAYIPKERMKGVEAIDVEQLGSLDASLTNGEYQQLGKVTAEEAGFQCLRPGSTNLADCDKIAEKFFGPEGVRMLQQAREGTNNVKKYYEEGIDKMSLKLPTGQKVLGREAIKNQCDKAFEGGDFSVSRACGELAVKTGMATQKEMDRGLKMLESFSDKARGRNIKFDECRFNPRACEEFIPDDFRDQYQAEQKIFQIMSASIGFDPQQCEFNSDPEIGLRCLEGSKKALVEIEAQGLAAQSPEAQRIVSEINGHLAEGERMASQMQKFMQAPPLEPGFDGPMPQTPFQFSGPGGCSTPQACFQYCSDVSNAAACVSFGAQQNIFQGDEAVQRFQKVTERVSATPFVYIQPKFNQFPNQQGQFDQRSQFGQQGQFDQQGQFGQQGQFNQQGQFDQQNQFGQQGQFPGTGPYYGFQPSFNQPGQMPGFTQPGQGFNTPGPSPACFEAIKNGNFELARTACGGFTPPTTQAQAQPYPVCPNIVPSPCSEGMYRQESTVSNGCPSYGACVPIPGYQPNQNNQTNICPSFPTVTECPAGQRKVVAFSSPQCGEYYTCQNIEAPTNTNGTFPYRFSDGFVAADYTTARSYCYQWGPGSGRGIAGECETRFGIVYQTQIPTTCLSNQWWDSATQSCRSSITPTTCPTNQYWNGTACSYTAPTVGSCNTSTQYWKASNSSCQPKTNCYDTTNLEYNTNECQGVRGTSNTDTTNMASSCPSNITSLLGYGCHSMSAGYFNGAMTSYVLFGSTTVNNCSTSPVDGCSGNTSTVPTVGSCSSTQYWKASNSSCQPRTNCYDTANPEYNTSECQGVRNTVAQPPTASCPLGYHPHSESGGFCMNDQENYSGTCYNPAGTSTIACPQNTSVGNCTGGQWWNGTACVSSNTSGSCPSGQWWYMPPSGGAGYCTSTTPSSSCSSGQYWNTSTNSCQSSTTSSNCSTPSTCFDSAVCASSGWYWYNGGCWNSSQSGGSTSCPSGQYWYTPSSGGAGYCMTTSTTDCPSGQWWDASTNSCQSSTSGGGGSTSCSSGQWWDYTTNSCQSSTSGGGGGGGGGTDPSAACTQAGGTWNTSTNICQMPGTSYSGSTLATLCNHDGGIWTGGACDLTGMTLKRLTRQLNGRGLAQVFRAIFGDR